MLGIIDYGVGNIYSIVNAVKSIGLSHMLIKRPYQMQEATKLLLPGVGAFDSAMDNLRASRLLAPLQETISQGVPVLGVCLGMQLLCLGSDEGESEGLGYFPYRVDKFPPPGPIPHMGWNTVNMTHPSLGTSLPQMPYFYFVHSYFIKTGTHTIGKCQYQETTFSAIIQKDHIWGVQFHPEKSGSNGLQLLKNFGRL